MPEDIDRKIKDSGLGYWSKWLPQTSILQHEVSLVRLRLLCDYFLI